MSITHIETNTKRKTSSPQQHRPLTRSPAPVAHHPAAIIQRARAAPESLSAADVLQLQRTIGNQAVGRLLAEASRLHSAGQKTPVQRQEIEEEEELLQGKMIGAVQRQPEPEEEEELLQGKTLQAKATPNRTGMPDHLKSGLETLSGMDLSGVRVEYRSSKPAQLNALAYTQGQEIHVASGQERHLPHEGWHAVQQMQGRVKPTGEVDGMPLNDSRALESEADVMGAKALAHEGGMHEAGPDPVSAAQGKFDSGQLTPMKDEARAGARTGGRRRPGESENGHSTSPVDRANVSYRPLRAAPIQRVLNHNSPILAADIAKVTELKMGSVFNLESNNGDQLIVKVEMFRVNEGEGGFTARHGITSELASQTLQGAPGTQPLSAADKVVLAALNGNLPGGGIAGLQLALGQVAQYPFAFFKAQHVNAGKSLGNVFNPPQVGAQWQSASPQPLYQEKLRSMGVQKALGRMATFDLLVSNDDRFRSDRTVNIDNLDFTAQGPIGIDNVDPNADFQNPWPGKQWFTNKIQMKVYATGAVANLLTSSNMQESSFSQNMLVASFVFGMQEAAQELKAKRTPLYFQAIYERDMHRHEALSVIVTRLDLMHP